MNPTTQHPQNARSLDGVDSPMRASGDRLLDAGEVAELLGVSKRWVRDHTRSGLLPHVPLGRYVRYRRAAVLAWVEGLERGGKAADWQKIRPRQYPKAVPNGR